MDRELTLDELLDEPIVRLLMRRDGVEANEIRALIETMRRRAVTVAYIDDTSRKIRAITSDSSLIAGPITGLTKPHKRRRNRPTPV